MNLELERVGILPPQLCSVHPVVVCFSTGPALPRHQDGWLLLSPDKIRQIPALTGWSGASEPAADTPGASEFACMPQSCRTIASSARFAAQLTAGVACRPPILGQVPAARFRHSAVHVTADPGSSLHRAVSEGLGNLPNSRASFLQGQGHLVLLSGGYDTQGREFGGPDLEVSPVKHARLMSCQLPGLQLQPGPVLQLCNCAWTEPSRIQADERLMCSKPSMHWNVCMVV